MPCCRVAIIVMSFTPGKIWIWPGWVPVYVVWLTTSVMEFKVTGTPFTATEVIVKVVLHGLAKVTYIVAWPVVWL